MSKISLAKFYSKYKGKYIKAVSGGTASSIDWNGTNEYAGQCASLARQYLVQVHGYKNKAYGNGKDFVNIPNAKIVSSPKDGDVVVYPNMTQWGHVSVYYKKKQIDQNPNKTGLRNLYAGKKIYIRPNYKAPALKKFSKPRKYKVIVDAVQVRKSSSATGALYKTLKKNKTFWAVGYIDINGYRWLLHKNSTGKKYYTAEFASNNKSNKYVKDIT